MAMKTPPLGRYLLVVALFALCAVAMAGWFHRQANRQAAADQLATAQAHFRNAFAALEQRWGREAFSLKARLESIGYLDDSGRNDRLLAYLTSQGGSVEFPSLRVEDARGKVLFAHDHVRHRLPTAHFFPSQESAWAYEPGEERLFLVYRQLIWTGKENGYLYLYKPMDHALLGGQSYPGTDLSLWWEGKAVASSEGQDGLAAEAAGSAAGKGEVTLPWGDEEGGSVPLLKVRTLPRQVFSADDMALPLLAALLVFAAGAWLALCRRRD